MGPHAHWARDAHLKMDPPPVQVLPLQNAYLWDGF
jgi:hypothetical protein